MTGTGSTIDGGDLKPDSFQTACFARRQGRASGSVEEVGRQHERRNTSDQNATRRRGNLKDTYAGNIEWLIDMEHLSCELYKDVRIFMQDEAFNRLLNHLAEDEVWHFHVMGSATDFTKRAAAAADIILTMLLWRGWSPLFETENDDGERTKVHAGLHYHDRFSSGTIFSIYGQHLKERGGIRLRSLEDGTAQNSSTVH
jgi:hypothetical protein